MDTSGDPGDKPVRARFNGESSDIAAVLMPYVTKALWLQYGSQMDASPIQAEVIAAHSEWVGKLKALQSNLSFNSTTMEWAMRDILDKKKAQINLPTGQDQDWVKVCAKRVRTSCRHTYQASLKRSPPTWYLNLPFVRSESAAGSAPAVPQAAKGKARKKGEYIFGWDYENWTGWRSSGVGKAQERCQSLKVGDPSLDEPVVAVWKDGVEHAYPEMTTAKYNDRATVHSWGRRTFKDPKETKYPTWAGVRAITADRITLKFRPDRKPLYSIYSEGNQVMQIQIQEFWKTGDTEVTDEHVHQAFDWMRGTAERFAKGEISVDEMKVEKAHKLKAMKAERAKEIKAQPKAEATMKKPSQKVAKKPEEKQEQEPAKKGRANPPKEKAPRKRARKDEEEEEPKEEEPDINEAELEEEEDGGEADEDNEDEEEEEEEELMFEEKARKRQDQAPQEEEAREDEEEEACEQAQASTDIFTPPKTTPREKHTDGHTGDIDTSFLDEDMPDFMDDVAMDGLGKFT